jgi:hypothetical protein
MNIHSSPGIRFKLLAMAVALMPVGAIAQVAGADMVRVEGRVQSEQDRKNLKNTMADQVTQGKTIILTITGKAKTPETRTGTWVAYAHDLKKHGATEELDRGEFKIDFSSGPQTVETKKIDITYTPEHSVSSGRMNTVGRGNTQTRYPQNKRVEAQGKKFAGYIVTVKDGDKVVGTYSEPPGFSPQAK